MFRPHWEKPCISQFIVLFCCINATSYKQILCGEITHLLSVSCVTANAWLTRSGLRRLRGLPLTSLVLAGCQNLRDSGLKALREMPLSSLDLTDASWLTNSALRYLKELPLTSLNLSQTSHRWLTDSGLRHLRLMPLTRLELFNCNWLSDAGVEKLVNLPLASLNLGRSEGVTYEAMEYLKKMPLTWLKLDAYVWDELARHEAR